MKQQNERLTRSAIVFFLVMIAIIFLGTVSFSIVENWTWLESLYMTLITVTTVGFGEVHPLSENGRIITLLILVGGLITFSVGISTLTRFVVEKELGGIFW